MKISARNVFEGTVASVQPGAVNAEVGIALGGSDQLVAVVTMESVRSLELVEGAPVLAIVKAPWVLLMSDDSGVRLSARNQLRGTVKSVETGAVNAEVVLTLAGGSEITAIVTREAAADLGLQPGSPATAVIKASSVILGVPA